MSNTSLVKEEVAWILDLDICYQENIPSLIISELQKEKIRFAF
ncbi:7443_t:CDS:1, partial [Gigaspora margarita]